MIAQQKSQHTVQKGETIESIAKQYNVTVVNLREANPDIDQYFYVGLKLNIPKIECLSESIMDTTNVDNRKDCLEISDQQDYANANNQIISKEQIEDKPDKEQELYEMTENNDNKANSENAENTFHGYRQSNIDTVISIIDSKNIRDSIITFQNLANKCISNDGGGTSSELIIETKRYLLGASIFVKEEAYSSLLSKISSLLEMDRKEEVLTAINLYQFVTNNSGNKMETLLFVKGNIYAERADNEHLKMTIEELKNDTFRNNVEVNNYISVLSNHLEEISDSKHYLKNLDGLWVADDLFWYGGKKNRIRASFPKNRTDIFANIKYDLNADTLSICIDGRSNISAEIGLDMDKNKPIVNTPQIIIPFASDSLYILWSSDKINRNSPEFAPLFRGAVTSAAASVSAEFAQKNKYNFGEQLLSGVLTSAAEVALNSIISSLFTPTKRIYVLEARLKVENDYLLTGTLKYMYKWIAADGLIYEDKKMYSNVKMVRWLPESKVIFTYSWIAPVFHPLQEKEFGEYLVEGKHKINKKMKLKQFTDYLQGRGYRYAYCKDKIGEMKSLSRKSVIAYNNDQYKWLQLYNDSLLKSRGYKGRYAIPDNAVPYVGIQFIDLTEKILKKNNIDYGVYVESVEEKSPAYLAGLKEKDIILRVNNTNIKSKTELMSIIRSTKLGEWMLIKVLRKKEMLDLNLRVMWN